MKIQTINTRTVLPPKDNLWDVLKVVKKLEEKSVVVLSSKIIAICQGRCVKKNTLPKDHLIAQEADWFLPRNKSLNHGIVLTIKNNVLIPSAGIDESNSGDYYVLWPKNIESQVKKIWKHLKKKSSIQKLGVIIADSHTTPLRRGTMGISLGYHGFEPIKDYRGKKDLFGRTFKVQTLNVADSIAAAAVLEMGEGKESTPLAICTGIKNISFNISKMKKKRPYSQHRIPLSEDLYGPFLKATRWKKGGGKK